MKKQLIALSILFLLLLTSTFALTAVYGREITGIEFMNEQVCNSGMYLIGGRTELGATDFYVDVLLDKLFSQGWLRCEWHWDVWVLS